MEGVGTSKPVNVDAKHYEKKRCFVIGLATQFLSCIRHLQLIIFICCECVEESKEIKIFKHL
jgi:hypothetical protein